LSEESNLLRQFERDRVILIVFERETPVAILPVAFVVIFIPICAFIGIQAGKRKRMMDARRIAEYRTSPESHLLNLRD
jgi:hypothetical protein